jgi:hypothetical protein
VAACLVTCVIYHCTPAEQYSTAASQSQQQKVLTQQQYALSLSVELHLVVVVASSPYGIVAVVVLLALPEQY